METARSLVPDASLRKQPAGDNMRSMKCVMASPTTRNEQLRSFAAQEFQTAIVGMMGHDLRQSLQVIQGTYSLLRSGLNDMPQQAWLDRGEQAVKKLTEQLD